MKTARRRRQGATETIGVSLDSLTKQRLKDLAAAKHGGNVSALISEMAEDAIRQAAFEKAWGWYAGPDLDKESRAKIDAELEEGWLAARKRNPGTRRRRKSAA
jgi:hypothetical protein